MLYVSKLQLLASSMTENLSGSMDADPVEENKKKKGVTSFER